jgi:hypothetical protein
VLVCAKYTTEKRLMIDISAVREGFNRRDIRNVRLIRSAYNIADVTTKFSSNSALQNLLKSHRVDHPVEQYVVNPLPYVKYPFPSNTPLLASEQKKPFRIIQFWSPVETPQDRSASSGVELPSRPHKAPAPKDNCHSSSVLRSALRWPCVR